MKSLLLIALSLFVSLSAWSQYSSEAADVQVYIKTGESLMIGEPANLTVEVEPKRGWHVYSSQPSDDGAYMPTEMLIAEESKGLDAEMGDILERGELTSEHDDIMGGMVHYYKEKVFFTRSIKVTAPDVIVVGSFDYMACNDVKCVPFTVDFTAQAAAKQ